MVCEVPSLGVIGAVKLLYFLLLLFYFSSSQFSLIIIIVYCGNFLLLLLLLILLKFYRKTNIVSAEIEYRISFEKKRISNIGGKNEISVNLINEFSSCNEPNSILIAILKSSTNCFNVFVLNHVIS